MTDVSLSLSLSRIATPSQQSRQLVADSKRNDAQGASPLEFVKLARTRGSRMFRAVETKKKTYLAVLCGEEGDRIELFTVRSFFSFFFSFLFS